MHEPRTVSEQAYGGTNKQVGPQPGDLLMIADRTIIANQFEIIVTNPMEIDDGKLNAKGMMFLVTFKGILNNDGRMEAVTLMMLPEMVKQLIPNLRRLYSEIPIEYR